MSMEPSISNIVANMHACLRVKTLEPTLVPNELATSFAPIPKANINAIMNPQITSQNCESQQSIVFFRLIIQIKTVGFKILTF
jgi:hypothetical protein